MFRIASNTNIRTLPTACRSLSIEAIKATYDLSKDLVVEEDSIKKIWCVGSEMKRYADTIIFEDDFSNDFKMRTEVMVQSIDDLYRENDPSSVHEIEVDQFYLNVLVGGSSLTLFAVCEDRVAGAFCAGICAATLHSILCPDTTTMYNYEDNLVFKREYNIIMNAYIRDVLDDSNYSDVDKKYVLDKFNINKTMKMSVV